MTPEETERQQRAYYAFVHDRHSIERVMNDYRIAERQAREWISIGLQAHRDLTLEDWEALEAERVNRWKGSKGGVPVAAKAFVQLHDSVRADEAADRAASRDAIQKLKDRKDDSTDS